MKTYYLFILTFFLISCTQEKQYSGYIEADISKLTKDFDKVVIKKSVNDYGFGDTKFISDTINAKDGKFEYHYKVDEPHNTAFYLLKKNKRIGQLSFRISYLKTEVFLANPSFGNEDIKIFVDSIYTVQEFNEIKHYRVDFEGSEEAIIEQKSFYYNILNERTIKKHPSNYALLRNLIYKSDTYSLEELKHLSSLFSDDLKKSKTYSYLKTYIKNKENLDKNGFKNNFNWVDTTGKTYNFEQVRNGKEKILLVFWASWCHPCRAEIPELKKFYSKYNEKVALVSLSIDSKYENWEKAVEQEKMPWLNLSGLPTNKSGVGIAYNITGVPTMILVDKNGKILKRTLNDLNSIEQELLK